jgi:fluoride exporter
MTTFLAVIAGSVGAAARYGVAGAVQRRTGSSLPVGTAAVNLVGALALGVIVGIFGTGAAGTAVLGGLLGGFTTFSTWMVETVRLAESPAWRREALMNVTGQLLAGAALAAVGYYLFR